MRPVSGIPMQYVVVGHGTAGQTAAAVLKKVDPDSEVYVIEKGRHVSIHPCALPMVLGGRLPLEAVIESAPKGRINVMLRSEAKRVDLENKTLIFERDGETDEISYDRLIIATGLKPIFPKVEGMDLEGVGTVWDVESVERLIKVLGNRVVVVGGSATGIEVAAELARTGRDVTLIEAMEQLMPGKIDPPIASSVAKALADMGVKVKLKAPMIKLEGSGGRLQYVLTPAGKIEAETAVVVIGAKPNSDLAAASGLEIGETGAVKVNDYLFTSDPHVLAAGDVAEVRDFVTGQPTATGLASTALVQGRIAAENAAGLKIRYKGALSPYLVSVGDYWFGGVGISASKAEKLGMEYRAFRFAGSDLPRYMPERDKFVVWLVTDPEGKLLGAQVFGRRGVRERVVFLTAAIYAGFRVQDIRLMEFAYQPEVCDLLDPIAVAAEGMSRKYRLLEPPSDQLG